MAVKVEKETCLLHCIESRLTFVTFRSYLTLVTLLRVTAWSSCLWMEFVCFYRANVHHEKLDGNSSLLILGGKPLVL